MELLEIDELPFDEVCRTCLCAGNNSLELLNNPDELEMANFVSMLSQTFRIEIVNIEKLSEISQNIHFDLVLALSFQRPATEDLR